MGDQQSVDQLASFSCRYRGYILLRYHANPLTCNMRLPSDAFALGEGPTRGDYLTWAFMPLRRIVPLRGTLSCAFGAALLQGPTRGGLSHMRFHAAATNCASSRHSILRLWRGPSPRAYSRGIISHGLLYRCGELCLFEALYPAPLARPFSKGLRAGIISHGLSCHHWDENRYSDPPLFFLHQFQRRCKVADEFPLPPAEVVIDDSDTGEVKFHCRTTGGE